MFVYRSNRTEVLADKLAATVRTAAGPATQPECIVVQGPGMQRWLTLVLAERLGIWANPQFPFPRTIVEQALQAVCPRSEPSIFEAGRLMWAVASQLQIQLDAAPFAPLRRYLREDVDGRKLFQLAERIAKVFDRYALYRPDLVRSWERGEGTDWQACLWRGIVEAFDGRHVANQLEVFLAKISEEQGPIEGLPRRISLFGISALPPLYTRVLHALSQRIEVHLFVLSPSQEYFGDLDRRALDGQGNPLLLSLGKLAGDFQQVLEEQAPGYQEPDDSLYVEPVCNGPLFANVLSTLQSDILNMRHRRQRLTLGEADDSLAIHSCHSEMRELEILHDQLVARFEADPTLQPHEVVVMAPNIEQYAPLIDAVFGVEGQDRPRIAYRISDRSERSAAPVLQAFSQVLSTLRGRMTASEVTDLLSFACVREKFELLESDLELVRRWVAETGIRWGVDAQARAEVQQPAFSENTWQFGLDRLLLGYAMTSEGTARFGDVLPFDNVEGSESVCLGNFAQFCSTLFSFRVALQQPLPAEQWATTLLGVLQDLLVEGEDNLAQHQLVRSALDQLVEGARAGKFDGPIPFDTVFKGLEEAWNQGDAVRGFLSRGVTFCQLMPMRSIPFRMVCVLGLSDGKFPRSPPSVGFDLLADSPQVGDRSAREEDRYLFLEALLSARQALLLSFVGQSIETNERYPPSVLLGQLLDVLAESFDAPEGTVRDRLVVDHALQPFSPAYFVGDNRLFSYSQAYCDGARSLSAGAGIAGAFVAAPLAETTTPESDSATGRLLEVEQLVEFYRNPSKYWLQRRLGLFMPEAKEALEDREPMQLQGLEAYQVGESLLTLVLGGSGYEGAYDSLRAAGVLPLGRIGLHAMQLVQGEVADVAARAQAARKLPEGQRMQPRGLPVHLRVDDTVLVGTIDQLWPGGRVVVGYRRSGGAMELGQWVRHLVLNALDAPGVDTRTTIVGRRDPKGQKGTIELPSVGNAQELLEPLVRLFWVGQRIPLPFFCVTARQFAQRLRGQSWTQASSADLSKAYSAARTAFEVGPFSPGESDDAYVRRVFDVARALQPSYSPVAEPPAGYAPFPQLADMVFSPLLATRVELS